MNPSIKKKWVKALRSGRYQQITEQLSDGFGYCCLGVLCKIEKVDRERIEKGAILPDELKYRAEISSIEQDYLVDMNDNKLASFPQIADWIEENL